MPIHDRDSVAALKTFLGKFRNPSAARRAAKALTPHLMEIRNRLVKARRVGHRVALSQPLDRLLFGV